jgi:hypothetical protein
LANYIEDNTNRRPTGSELIAIKTKIEADPESNILGVNSKMVVA